LYTGGAGKASCTSTSTANVELLAQKDLTFLPTTFMVERMFQEVSRYSDALKEVRPHYIASLMDELTSRQL
jgi:hypothetical protein